MSVASMMLSNHLILCCPLILLHSSFPASGSFPVSALLTSGGPSIGAVALASVLVMNIQDWFPLRLTGLISLLSKGLTRVFSTQFKGINSSGLGLLYGPTLISVHDYWKNYSFDYMHICWQMESLLLDMLSRLAINFLPRSKWLLILWLQSPSAPQNKVCHCSHCFPIYFPWSDGTRCHDLHFWVLSFKPTFHSPLSLSSRGSLVPLHFLP